MISTPFRLRLTSHYACYPMPGTGAEPFSYPVPTPSGLVGSLCAIFAKPQMTYDIHEIVVEKPLKTMSIRSTGCASKPNSSIMRQPYDIAKDPFLQTRTILCDVSYVVTASIRTLPKEIDPSRKDLTPTAYLEQFLRRARKKQTFRPFHLGFKGSEPYTKYELLEGDDVRPPAPIPLTMDFGMMFYGREFSAERVGNRRDRVTTHLFYRAVMREGVIGVPLPACKSIVRQDLRA